MAKEGNSPVPLRPSGKGFRAARERLWMRHVFGLALIVGMGLGGWAGYQAASPLVSGRLVPAADASVEPQLLLQRELPVRAILDLHVTDPNDEEAFGGIAFKSAPDKYASNVDVVGNRQEAVLQSPTVAAVLTEKKAPLAAAEPQRAVQPRRGRVAIIIDDLGLDEARARQMAELPAVMTMSYLSYAKNLGEQTHYASERGHEIFAHVPMQPGGDADPGPNALMTWHTRTEIAAILKRDLAQFTNLQGVNNHMGSKFTRNEMSMSWFMAEVKGRGLLYVDSLTSGSSRGYLVAKAHGMPELKRDVFIDHDLKGDRAGIDRQLETLEKLALSQGDVIAIGHPYKETVAALAEWLPGAKERGVEFVTVARLEMGQDAERSYQVTEDQAISSR